MVPSKLIHRARNEISVIRLFMSFSVCLLVWFFLVLLIQSYLLQLPIGFLGCPMIFFWHSFISRLSTHKFREISKFFLFHIKKYFKIKSLFYALLCTSVSVENLCSWFVKIFQEALDNSSAVSASQFTLNCFVLLLLFFPDALSKTSALFHLVLT